MADCPQVHNQYTFTQFVHVTHRALGMSGIYQAQVNAADVENTSGITLHYISSTKCIMAVHFLVDQAENVSIGPGRS